LPPAPRLAFAETSAEAALGLRLVEARQVDAVIASDPDAAWYCYQGGAPCLLLEDAYAEMQVYRRTEQVIAEHGQWAKWVDDRLAQRIAAFASSGFRPTYMYLYWFNLLFDGVYTRTLILDQVLDHWKPSALWFTPAASPTAPRDSRTMMPFASTFQDLLPVLAAAKHIETHHWTSVPRGRPAAYGTTSRLIDALRHLKRRIVTTRDAVNRAIWSARGRRNHDRGPRPLVLQPGYDLKPLLKRAYLRGVPVVLWGDLGRQVRERLPQIRVDDIARQMAEAWEPISSCPEFRLVARPAGYDFWPLVEERVRWWWHTVAPEQWAAYEATRQHVANNLPRAVALPNLLDHVDRAIFHGLKKCGVPAYIFQHGGFVGPCAHPAWDLNDLWHADIEFTYGDGTTEYFAKRRANGNEIRALPLSVGSTTLNALVTRYRRPGRTLRRTPRVLLVPNVIPRANRYFNGAGVPDVTAAETQAQMVMLAREFPQFDFLFKPFHNQVDTPAVRLAAQKGSNCRIVRYQGLLRLLPKADLILLDFPSTALLQALATDRPLVVLVDTRFLQMNPDALELLRRRAAVGQSLDDFLDLARAFLRRGSFPRIAHPDDEFLKRYGTYRHDGRSTERALDALTTAAEARTT
jgi:hypothetical protein